MKPRSVFLLIAVFAVACATNPVTGERELMLVSEAQEIEMGRSYDQQIVEYYGLYDDPELAAWIERVGQRMAAASERPDLPWTFRVVDDTAVNAFALPGGFVYMTRGILTYMTSEAEVAGVLGHEIGHVTARHSAQQLSRAQVAQLGLGVGMVLSDRVEALGGLLEGGVGLLFLKFGRDDESQADELGVRYAANAGYDPRQLSNFFATINRLSERAGGRLPTWLSTHPDPLNRRENVLEWSEPFVERTDGLVVGREEHLQRVDGIVFGPNPREGVMVGRTFKHPDLQFQMDFPAEWAVQNGKAQVVATPENGEAVAALSAENRGELSLAAYARRVVEQREGALIGIDDVRVAGQPGVVAEYRVQSQGVGVLRVRDLFLDYRGLTYDLLAYSRDAQWRQYEDELGRWQRSFRSLPASEADHYRPDRLDVFQAGRAGPLDGILVPNAAVDLETLALINGFMPDTTISSGTSLKRVVPGYER